MEKHKNSIFKKKMHRKLQLIDYEVRFFMKYLIVKMLVKEK
jgi:hypothetical protein